MKRLIQDLAYSILLVGALLGFLIGAIGGLRSGSDPAVVLWKAALGACFSAFLVRLFLRVVLMSLRENAKERCEEPEESADIPSEPESAGSAS